MGLASCLVTRSAAKRPAATAMERRITRFLLRVMSRVYIPLVWNRCQICAEPGCDMLSTGGRFARVRMTWRGEPLCN